MTSREKIRFLSEQLIYLARRTHEAHHYRLGWTWKNCDWETCVTVRDTLAEIGVKVH